MSPPAVPVEVQAPHVTPCVDCCAVGGVRCRTAPCGCSCHAQQDQRFWAKVNKDGPVHPVLATACWVWTRSTTDFGHGQVRIERRLHRAHRVSYERTIGAIPDGAVVLHRCDNPPCVRGSHLFLGTKADNTADMMAKGRGRYVTHSGAASGTAKLTAESVAEIRRRYGVGRGKGQPGPVSQKSLAKEFGVTQTLIGAIVRGEIWR